MIIQFVDRELQICIRPTQELTLNPGAVIVPRSCHCAKELSLCQRAVIVPKNCYCPEELSLCKRAVIVPKNCYCAEELPLCQRAVFVPKSCYRSNGLSLYLGLLGLSVGGLLDLILSFLGESNAEKTQSISVARFH